MARARNIKPGFFRNADLLELPYEARLLFIGLWTIADREGRLEDRPRQIKVEIFPADNVDIDACIASLASIGALTRYEIDGKKCIQIVNFSKHQNPHKAEQPSTLPDQCGNYATPAQAPNKHGASTVQAPCNSGAGSEVAGLIPDSLLLIPSSMIPDPLPDGESERQPSTAIAAQPRKRASKVVPQDFEVTDEMLSWARSSHPSVDLQTQTSAFRDHEFKDAKTDWVKAWRNWIRRSEAIPQGRPQQASKHSGFDSKDYSAGANPDGSLI